MQVASAPVSSYDTQITHKRRCRRCGNGGRLSKFDGRRGRSSTRQSQHGKKAPPSWKIQRLSARVWSMAPWCSWKGPRSGDISGLTVRAERAVASASAVLRRQRNVRAVHARPTIGRRAQCLGARAPLLRRSSTAEDYGPTFYSHARTVPSIPVASFLARQSVPSVP